MKKLLAILLAALMCATLASCGLISEAPLESSLSTSEPSLESDLQDTSSESFELFNDDSLTAIKEQIAEACGVDLNCVTVEETTDNTCFYVRFFFDYGNAPDTVIGDSIINSCQKCEPIISSLDLDKDPYLMLCFPASEELPDSFAYLFGTTNCESGVLESSWDDKTYPIFSLDDIATYLSVSDNNSSQEAENQSLTKVYEDDKVIIYFKEVTSDGVYFEVENLTDANITIQADSVSVNKRSTNDIVMSDDVAPQSIGTICARCEVDYSEPITTIGGQLRIIDFNDSFDTYDATFVNIPIE